ncbi:MAG: LamG domain-containing protein [Deltaproteobacteria bacterium]|nr:LamG domain-containing protein [Deltaproteobacteria bacterium]
MTSERIDVRRPIPFRNWLIASLLLILGSTSANAAIIGYWRMETDLDADPDGFEVANEIAFGTSLFSSEAFIDTAANPNFIVPLTGEPNAGSAGATMQGANNGINATAAWYAELDVTSITIEFWTRTVENTATLFSRTTGNDGIRIWNPNSLDVEYWVEDGLGGATRVQLLNVYNMDSSWHHMAFTYDEVSGNGLVWVDGVAVGWNDGPDNRALVWGAQVDLELGDQMDYAAAFNGTLDEVRIMDEVAGSSAPTLAPEPSAFVLASAGLLGLLAAGRRRRRR